MGWQSIYVHEASTAHCITVSAMERKKINISCLGCEVLVKCILNLKQIDPGNILLKGKKCGQVFIS